MALLHIILVDIHALSPSYIVTSFDDGRQVTIYIYDKLQEEEEKREEREGREAGYG